MKLLDTSVLVDIDRGQVDEQVSKLDDEGRHAISVVSVTELHLGIHRQYERGTSNHDEAIVALERLCSRFEVLDTTRAVAVRAAEVIAELRERGSHSTTSTTYTSPRLHTQSSCQY